MGRTVCLFERVICISSSSSSSYFFNYAFIKKIKLLHSHITREMKKEITMKEMRGARLTRRQSQILWIMQIGVKERASEKKLRPISIHAKKKKIQKSEGERKKEFFFILKEKRRTFDSRAQIFFFLLLVAAKRAPAPTSADLSDLNKKLLQHVSFSLPLDFVLARNAIRDLYLCEMHTQMFCSKGLIFFSLSLLLIWFLCGRCPVKNILAF